MEPTLKVLKKVAFAYRQKNLVFVARFNVLPTKTVMNRPFIIRFETF